MAELLLERLDRAAARADRARRAAWVLTGLAVASGYFAAVALADRSAGVPRWSRAVGLAVVAISLGICAVRSRRRASALELARGATQRWPAEGGDVLCALELGASEARAKAPQLVEAALARIETRTAALDLDALRDPRPLRFGAVAAGVATTMLVALWIANPSAMAVASKRVLLLADDPYPTRTRIVALAPGDARLADPESVVLAVVHAEGELPERGALELRTHSGIELEVELERRADDSFAAALPHLGESYRYRARLGDARSVEHAVLVVPPPLVELALEVRPPAGFAGGVQVLEARSELRVIEGSALALALRSDKELASVRSVARPELAFEITSTGAICAPFALWEELELELEVLDRDGLAPRSPVRLRARVDPDQRPRVELERAPELITLRPEGTLRLAYRAADDGSLEALALHVEPFSSAGEDGTKTGAAFDFELALPPAVDGARGEAEGVAELALARIAAQAGSRWQCWIAARDGRAHGSNHASSALVTVRVVDEATFDETLAERVAEVARHHVHRFQLEQRELARAPAPRPDDARQLAARQRELAQRIAELVALELGPVRAWLADNALARGARTAPFDWFEEELALVAERGRVEVADALEAAPADPHVLARAQAVQEELAVRLLSLVQRADPAIVVAELTRALETLVRMQQDSTRAVGARLRFYSGEGTFVEAPPADSFDAVRRAHERVLHGYSGFVGELGASLAAGGADEAVERCARTGLEAGVLAKLGGVSTLFELGGDGEELERTAILKAAHQSLRDVLRGMAAQLVELHPNSPLALNVLLELSEERDLRAAAGGLVAGAGRTGPAGSGGTPASAKRSEGEAPGSTSGAEPGPAGEVVTTAEESHGDAPAPAETGPELERQDRGELSKETQKKKFAEFDPVHQRDLSKLPGRQTNQLVENKAVAEELESSMNEQARLERQMASMNGSSSSSARSEIENELREQEESLREKLGGAQGENARSALQNAKDARQAFGEGRDEDARDHQRQALEYTLATYVEDFAPKRTERDPGAGSNAPPPDMPSGADAGGAADDESGRTGGGLLVEIRSAEGEALLAPELVLPPPPGESGATGRLWVFDLPPGLQERLRLENPAATPPGYERRMRSYFQSID